MKRFSPGSGARSFALDPVGLEVPINANGLAREEINVLVLKCDSASAKFAVIHPATGHESQREPLISANRELR